MSERIQKINTLLRKHIDTLITRELSIPLDVFITISKVTTTRDLRQAKVFLSVFPESRQEYIQKTMSKETKRLQKLLYKKLSMKPLPKITFVLDSTEYHADKVEKILISLKDES